MVPDKAMSLEIGDSYRNGTTMESTLWVRAHGGFYVYIAGSPCHKWHPL